MNDPDWPSGTPEWDERDDLYEIHEISCDMGEDCTCGGGPISEGDQIEVDIWEPTHPTATLITFWVIPPMTMSFGHVEYGPFEL